MLYARVVGGSLSLEVRVYVWGILREALACTNLELPFLEGMAGLAGCSIGLLIGVAFRVCRLQGLGFWGLGFRKLENLVGPCQVLNLADDTFSLGWLHFEVLLYSTPNPITPKAYPKP